MRFIFSCLLLIMIAGSNFSCQPKLRPVRTSLNQESRDVDGNPMLLGICTKERLVQNPFGSWFNLNYSNYKIDTAVAEKLRTKLVNIRFEIFMGTWCGDSRREVPRMFKILDYCGVTAAQIELITLSDLDSSYKQSPGHEERGLDIHRVPDLIVFSDKKEIGRIVESPVVSLEKDLSAIINGENYIPNYHAVSFLSDLFRRKEDLSFGKNPSTLAIQIKPMVVSPAELNTYGYVLLAAHQTLHSRLVFELNTLLYPENANSYLSLANFYIRTGNKNLAKENLNKAISLQPDNEAVKKKLELLNQK
jgi:hypothetical protein